MLSEFKKRLLLRCKHNFKSDWINNMDHICAFQLLGDWLLNVTCISVTEPSSVVLRQSSLKILKSDAQKYQKQGKAKMYGVINIQNYNLNDFRKIWCPQNTSNQPKSTVKLGFIGNHTNQSKVWRQSPFIRSFDNFCSFSNTICRLLHSNLKKEIEHTRLYERWMC